MVTMCSRRPHLANGTPQRKSLGSSTTTLPASNLPPTYQSPTRAASPRHVRPPECDPVSSSGRRQVPRPSHTATGITDHPEAKPTPHYVSPSVEVGETVVDREDSQAPPLVVVSLPHRRLTTGSRMEERPLLMTIQALQPTLAVSSLPPIWPRTCPSGMPRRHSPDPRLMRQASTTRRSLRPDSAPGPLTRTPIAMPSAASIPAMPTLASRDVTQYRSSCYCSNTQLTTTATVPPTGFLAPDYLHQQPPEHDHWQQR